jgi:hypothetical protein
MSNNNPYGQSCRKDIPYPSVSNESVPSLIDNLVNALYGTISKTVVDRKVVWDIPCDPDNTATVFDTPRLPGEGLLCYFIRVFNQENLAVQNLSGGSIGSLPYQDGVSSTVFLPIGSSGYVLTSDGSSPVWSPAIPFSGTATNIAGGSLGSIPYQSAASTTQMLGVGASGFALTSNGSGPVWTSSVNRATNISSGASGSIPYQTASSTTSFIGIGSANSVLLSNGTSPYWSSSVPIATSAQNISGGAYGQIPWQSGASSTSFIPSGAAGQVLKVSAFGGFEWSYTVGNANLAQAVNPQFGSNSAGAILYQVSTNGTAGLAAGPSGYILQSQGAAAPQWVQYVPLATSALSANNATTASTATNVAPSSGNTQHSILYQASAGLTYGVSGSQNQVLIHNGVNNPPSFGLIQPANLSPGGPSWSSVTGTTTLSNNTLYASLNLSPLRQPAAPVAGDVWISNSTNKLCWCDGVGFQNQAASTSRENSFTQSQSISTTDNFNPAFKIVQLGTAEAFRVEDESPESTPFTISASGKVGVGVASDASVCLSLDSTGVKFSDGSIQTTCGIRAKGQILASGTVVQPGSLNIQSINATTTGQKIITFAAAAGVSSSSTVVATLNGALNGFLRVSSVTTNTVTIITANTAGTATNLDFSIAVF